MRTVVHVITTAGPGGGETVCAKLAAHVAPGRWRAVVILPEPGWLLDELNGLGVQTIVARPPRRGAAIGLGVRLAAAVARSGASLIHAHYFGPAVVAGLVGSAMRVPVVGTIHGQTDIASEDALLGLKVRIVNRGVKRLVCVSDALRQHIVSDYGIDPRITRVIPNGVDETDFARDSDRSVRAELGIADDAFVIGAIGNVRPPKGYDLLLHAAHRVHDRHPETRFVIAGDGGNALEAELLRLRDELGLRDVVHFLGFRRDSRRVLASLDTFVLTSRTEGFSLSTVEAMAAGLPIVATRCGGPEEILQDGLTGLLVENDSADAIADGLLRLRQDEGERARMSAAARVAATSRFTLAAQMAAYERLYDECVTRDRTADRSSSPGARLETRP